MLNILYTDLLRDCECPERAVVYVSDITRLALTHDDIMRHWQAYLRKGQRDPLSLYIHIPFCVQRCSYCSYFSERADSYNDLLNYKKYLYQLFERYAPVFHRVRFQHLYIGGGTPTIYNEQDLAEIIDHIHDSFHFTRNAKKTCEVNALTATKDKLLVLRTKGFQNISFGIQTFSAQALDKANRSYQTVNDVDRLMTDIRSLGFKEVNIDLLYGLNGDTPASFLRSFVRTMALKPSRITLYRLVPTKSYIARTSGGNIEDVLRHLNMFARKISPRLRSLSLRNGYFSRQKIEAPFEEHSYSFARFSWHTFLGPFFSAIPFLAHIPGYTDIPSDRRSLLGLGPTSRSFIFGKLSYYAARDTASDPRKNIPAYEGETKELHHEMIKYLLHSFKRDGKIAKADFRRVFHKDPLIVFRRSIRELISAGQLHVTPFHLTLVPKDNLQRFLALLRFIDPKVIILRSMQLIVQLPGTEPLTVRIEPKLPYRSTSFIFERGGYGMYFVPTPHSPAEIDADQWRALRPYLIKAFTTLGTINKYMITNTGQTMHGAHEAAISLTDSCYPAVKTVTLM